MIHVKLLKDLSNKTYKLYIKALNHCNQLLGLKLNNRSISTLRTSDAPVISVLF